MGYATILGQVASKTWFASKEGSRMGVRAYPHAGGLHFCGYKVWNKSKHERMNDTCRIFAELQTDLAITIRERDDNEMQEGHDLCRMIDGDRTRVWLV